MILTLPEIKRKWLLCEKDWFSKNDEYLNNIFHFDNTLEYYINYEYDNLPKDFLVSLIIVYDQFSRNYSRMNSYFDPKPYYIKSLEVSNLCVLKYDDELLKEDIIFITLCYRHNNVLGKIQYIIEKCIKFDLKKMVKLSLNEYLKKYNNYVVVDKKIDKFNFENFKNVLSKNIEYDKLNLHDIDYKLFYNYDKFIISLSGGVDSMLLLTLFYLNYGPQKLTCVHINYQNRKYSDLEAEMCISYCMFLGIKIVHRKISEIQRDICMNNNLRQIYEDYTRDVRFKTYEYVQGGDKNIPVILGHNSDDILENFFNNIKSYKSLDNLSGIKELSNINNMMILRPLYNTNKETIYKMAECLKVPYLYNTTPDWSMRGRFRNMIYDNLVKVYSDLIPKRIIEFIFNVEEMDRDNYELGTRLFGNFPIRVEYGDINLVLKYISKKLNLSKSQQDNMSLLIIGNKKQQKKFIIDKEKYLIFKYHEKIIIDLVVKM